MLDFIKSRRSTRKYKDMPVDEALINTVIEAGRYAPSGGNNQSTHFLVIENKEILLKLADLAQTAFAAMEVTPDMYISMANSVRAAKRGNYNFYYHAPVLILTANRVDYGNNIADVSCALENMMLMANALDLGSCWINQLRWLNEDPTILEYLRTLGLAENERVYGGLIIGYPDTEDGKPNRSELKRHGNEVTYIR